MKTAKLIRQNIQKTVLVILFSAASLIINARTVNPGTEPVIPTSFTAVLGNNGKVELKWSTEKETHLSHFVVEKSIDGRDFNDAALVFAYGNTIAESDYAFADNVSKIRSDYVYYRLLTIQDDGTIQYSDKRIVRINKETEKNNPIRAYLNPGSNELRITIPANWQNKKIVFELFDRNGKRSDMTETANSSQTEVMNLNSLAPGFYILYVTCNNETAQQKIIK